MSVAVQHFLQGMATVPPLAIYAFVFVWLALESCGLPLPNELVLLFTGSLAAHGIVSPVALVGIAVVGSALGATGAYEIGKRGGRAAVLRFGHYIRLDTEQLDAVERWFGRAGAVAIGVSRVTPFVRTISSFPAGMLRLPIRGFLVATVLGSLVWCAVMVGLGVLLGANYLTALNFIERYTIPAIVIFVILVAIYLWLHQRLAHIGKARIKDTPRDATPARRDTRRDSDAS